MKKVFFAICVICGCSMSNAQIQTNAGIQYLQCMQKDMSTDFYDLSNTYFFADSLVSFDAVKGEGLVQWKRYRMSPRQAFNLNGYWPVRMQMLDFPDAAYDNDPNLQIRIEWITPRTARIRMLTTPVIPKDNDQNDVMFCDAFKAKKGDRGTTINKSPYGSLRFSRIPSELSSKTPKARFSPRRAILLIMIQLR